MKYLDLLFHRIFVFWNWTFSSFFFLIKRKEGETNRKTKCSRQPTAEVFPNCNMFGHLPWTPGEIALPGCELCGYRNQVWKRQWSTFRSAAQGGERDIGMTSSPCCEADPRRFPGCCQVCSLGIWLVDLLLLKAIDHCSSWERIPFPSNRHKPAVSLLGCTSVPSFNGIFHLCYLLISPPPSSRWEEKLVWKRWSESKCTERIGSLVL